MKSRLNRPLIRLFAVLLSLLMLPEALASTVRTDPVGSAEKIFSTLSVYCNQWQELIGKPMGADLSFNPENIKKAEDLHYDLGGHQVTTFNFDGVYAEVDNDLNVYSVEIRIQEGEQAQYAATSRIFALISALSGDLPSSEAEMKQRYLSLLSEYLSFMEENRETLSAGNFAYWQIGDLELSFFREAGILHMLFDRMTFEKD